MALTQIRPWRTTPSHCPAAKLHPDRQYFFRPGNVDALLEAASRQLGAQPGHAKALFTRAACLMKKRLYAKAIEDFSVVRARERA